MYHISLTGIIYLLGSYRAVGSCESLPLVIYFIFKEKNQAQRTSDIVGTLLIAKLEYLNCTASVQNRVP